MLALKRGEVELDLIPEVGGAIARLAFRGRNVLRPAPRGATDPLETASFALLPYCNRIAYGAFRFGGENFALKPNFGAHPHCLHGHGWQRAWRVASVTPDSALLKFEYEPGDWPWAYSTEQSYTLTADGLRVELSLRNRGARAMPISLGFHPYFPKTPATTLRASVGGMWEIHATSIPVRRVAAAQLIDL